MYERVELTPHMLEVIRRGADKFRKIIERDRYVKYHSERDTDMR